MIPQNLKLVTRNRLPGPPTPSTVPCTLVFCPLATEASALRRQPMEVKQTSRLKELPLT
jgi:hypothetical protein